MVAVLVFGFEFRLGLRVVVLLVGFGEGRLSGGILSLLSASIGTPYSLDAKGKILFIEEVCEPITKIEKWMYHLRNAGKLADAAAFYLVSLPRSHWTTLLMI